MRSSSFTWHIQAALCRVKTSGPLSSKPRPPDLSVASQKLGTRYGPLHTLTTLLHLPLASGPAVPPPGVPFPTMSCQTPPPLSHWAPDSPYRKPPLALAPSSLDQGTFPGQAPPLLVPGFVQDTCSHVAFRAVLNSCGIILSCTVP